MSIYSANRMGSTASAAIVANEAYGADSFGRILYETQLNDQAIFEAVIAADMKECKALQEGTLLESEIAAMNEASVKDFFKAMGDRLKKFWEKIKGAIKAVVNKILAYVLKDGKAYVKEFEAKYKGDANAKATIEKYFDRSKVKILTHDEVNAAINAQKGDDTDKNAVISKALGKSIGIDSCTHKDYREEFVKATCSKEDKTIAELKKIISDGPAAIKDLKAIEKEVDTRLAQLAKVLKQGERDAAKDNKDAKPGDGIRRISMLVSAYETVTTTTVSAAIGATKANMRNSVKGLAQIMRDWKKTLNLKESAVDEVEGEVEADSVEAALDNNEPLTVDPETAKEADEVIKNVEDGLADA